MVVLLCATAQIQKDVQCPGATFPRLTHSQSIRVQETQSIFECGWGCPRGRVGRLGMAVGP